MASAQDTEAGCLDEVLGWAVQVESDSVGVLDWRLASATSESSGSLDGDEDESGQAENLHVDNRGSLRELETDEETVVVLCIYNSAVLFILIGFLKTCRRASCPFCPI